MLVIGDYPPGMGTGDPGDGRGRASSQKAPGESAYTIDEIAGATGVTPRNVRAYQSRGLLDPPTMRGRVGYYGDAHVTRLRLIQVLQQDGFNLAAIAAMLAAGETDAERMHRIRQPELDRKAVTLSAELSDDGHSALDEAGDALVQVLVSNGVIRRLPSGRYAAATPALLAAARQLVEHGASAVDLARVIGELSEWARLSAQEAVVYVTSLMRLQTTARIADAAHQFVLEAYRVVFDSHLAQAVAELPRSDATT